MNILVITTFYPEPDRKDLIQDTAVVHYFAKEWVKQGHEVTVLHCYPHYFREILKYRVGKYGNIKKQKDLDGVHILLMENQFFKRNARGYNKVQQIIIAKTINKYLKENMPEYKPDLEIVHFPSHFCGIVERLNFTEKKVAMLHFTDRKTIFQDNSIKKQIISTYDVIGTRSDQLRKELIEKGINVSFVAYSGIDQDCIRKVADVKLKWEYDKNILNIIYAGSFIKRKHVDKLIEALGKIKNDIFFKLTVIGDGQEGINIQNLARDCGIDDKCVFLGRLPREQVFAELWKANLFVMASSSETLGLVYLEAMAQGCIVIGSQHEGIDGIIRDKKNGFLVKAGDADSIAYTIKKIAGLSKKKKMEIAVNGIQTVNHLTSKKVAESYLMFKDSCV